MPIKRYKAEQIVTILRQIEVGIANGKLTPQASANDQLRCVPAKPIIRKR
jgi:hypothetical protein